MREKPRLRVAVFRPDDGRASEAAELIESLGADPVADPMLAIEPTTGEGGSGSGAPGSDDSAVVSPREDAEYVILTSKTGVEIAADEGWTSGNAVVCAIGRSTADAIESTGYTVDLVPEEYSSAGLVEALEEDVAGERVEVARSDHGSDVLTAGLEAAGAYVHETVLYRLVRPDGSGESVELAADGALDAALFTSSLTVSHFLAAADARGVRRDAIDGLTGAVVGAIGEPTRNTAEKAGIEVDVVPETADFETLATTVVEDAAPSYRE